MEPQRRPQAQRRGRRRRETALLVVLATAAVTLPRSSQAFMVPTPARLSLARPGPHALAGGGRARGGLWASTTQEPEPQSQQDAADASSLAAAADADDVTMTAAAAGKGFGAAPRAKTGTVNKRLMNVIDAELKVVQDNMMPDPTPASEDDTDLNGINPIQPLGAAVFASTISFLFWRITVGLATALNNVKLDTEWYPVKRAFGIASTAFVGITALGAGVIGVTALGLLGLAVRVAFGVATGELDMNKQKVAPPPSAVPLDAQGLPKVTGAWYDVPKKKKGEGK